MQTKYTAEYHYPGSFFAETTYRDIKNPYLESALLEAPDEDGYFQKDKWYAVTIREVTKERFISPETNEEVWLARGNKKLAHYIIGKKIHYTDIEDNERNSILRSNLRSNGKDGYGALTRCGNYQWLEDGDIVVDL